MPCKVQKVTTRSAWSPSPHAKNAGNSCSHWSCSCCPPSPLPGQSSSCFHPRSSQSDSQSQLPFLALLLMSAASLLAHHPASPNAVSMDPLSRLARVVDLLHVTVITPLLSALQPSLIFISISTDTHTLFSLLYQGTHCSMPWMQRHHQPPAPQCCPATCQCLYLPGDHTLYHYRHRSALYVISMP